MSNSTSTEGTLPGDSETTPSTTTTTACLCDPTYPTDDCNTSLCHGFLWAVWAFFAITTIWAVFVSVCRFVSIRRQKNDKAKITIAHLIVPFVAICSGLMFLRLQLLLNAVEKVSRFGFAFLYTQSLYFGFLAYSLLIFWWAQLYHVTTGMIATLVGRMKIGCIVANVFLYAVCLGIAIGEVSTSSSVASYLRVLYGAVTFVIATAFMIYGGRLIHTLRKFQHQDSPASRKVRWVFVWVCICSFSLIFLTIFQLATRFNKDESTSAFVGRHSVYYAVNLINQIFIMISMGGLRPWQAPKGNSANSTEHRSSTKARSQTSMHSNHSNTDHHSSAEVSMEAVSRTESSTNILSSSFPENSTTASDNA